MERRGPKSRERGVGFLGRGQPAPQWGPGRSPATEGFYIHINIPHINSWGCQIPCIPPLPTPVHMLEGDLLQQTKSDPFLQEGRWNTIRHTREEQISGEFLSLASICQNNVSTLADPITVGEPLSATLAELGYESRASQIKPLYSRHYFRV